MRKRFLAVILMIIISIPVFAQMKHPRLIVGIVVDQMRLDYLTSFYNQFGDGGFKKLIATNICDE